MKTPRPPLHEDHHSALLDRLLTQVLGAVDHDSRLLLRAELEPVDLPAGETLMHQGDAGDALYVCLAGRLRAFQTDAQGQTRRLRDMGRGEVIGELSLYTDEPRSASVVAVRDTALVRLQRAAFDSVVARSPALSMAVARQVIQRLRRSERGDRSHQTERSTTIGLLPISAQADAGALAAALAPALAEHLRVTIVDASHPALVGADSPAALALAISRLEAEHHQVLLVADAVPSAWTAQVCRHSDELLLVADADDPAAVHASERHFLAERDRAHSAQETLVLLHPADRAVPRGADLWLPRRPVGGHLHLRRGHAPDVARLARILARRATGLVLAGGGARGLAHLGVLRALQERHVAIDMVGGTSIGAIMAAMVAMDRPAAGLTAIARHAFMRNPTGDFNPLPLLSLIRGGRLREVIDEALAELMGPDPRLENLWLPCFIVASNYSKACEQVLHQGPLGPLLRASAAIPGALPPVVAGGDLLCDGGTFNNFPVDVMRLQRGIDKVIGVDLSARQVRPLSILETPGPWALALDRLRPRKSRRYRLPSLVAYLMNVTVLYSQSRTAQARLETDVYLNPPLYRVGMLAWKRFDNIVKQGYEYALQTLPPEGAVQAPADKTAA
jgi:NTE family protein